MASKGKGKEKQAIKSPPQAEPVKPPEREIVPGKITESQWAQLLDTEEGVEIVSELVEEVCEVAFSIVYSHYLEEQAFPHSVEDARHSLLKIIEWQFLSRDEGEVDTLHDPSWTEDQEAIPSSIDSWARGIVPQNSTDSLQSVVLSALPVQIQPSSESITAVQPEGDQEKQEKKASEMTDFNTSFEEKTWQRAKSGQSETNTSIASSGKRIKSTRVEQPSPSHRQPRRSRPKARRAEARMVALEHPPMIDESTTIEDPSQKVVEALSSPAHSRTPTSFTSEDPALLRCRPMPYGLKPSQLNWQKEVTYDERGNIIDMIKLDPATFRPKRLKPVIRILPQSSQQQQHHHHYHHRSKASTRLKSRSDGAARPSPASLTQRRATEMTRHGRGQRLRGVGIKTTPVMSGPGRDGLVTTKESHRFPEMPALPPLVDTIDPVPGVTVHEAGRSISGAKRHESLQPPTSPKSGMRLVRPLQQPPIKHSTSNEDVLTIKQPQLAH